MHPAGPQFHDDDEVTHTPYVFDLMGGKKLMDEGITAEMLESLTGNILPEQSPEEQAKVARQRMLASIIESSTDPNRVARARRGFASREEERRSKKQVKAMVRRYHRLTSGPRAAELKARAKKRRKAANKYARMIEALKTMGVEVQSDV